MPWRQQGMILETGVGPIILKLSVKNNQARCGTIDCGIFITNVYDLPLNVDEAKEYMIVEGFKCFKNMEDQYKKQARLLGVDVDEKLSDSRSVSTS